MAERLTEIGLFIDEPVYIIKKWKKSAAINKLAQLENILEKYGIESLEELEELLDDNKYAQNVVFKQLVELQNAKTDRDAWKRACELACDSMTKLGGDDCCGCRLNKEMCNICDNKKDLIDYFYQQAKMEGNDE